MMYRRWLSIWSFAMMAAGPVTVGCKSESNTEATKSARENKDGGARPSGVDPDIAAAVSEVAKAPLGATSQTGEKAPPPNGVFAPGEADKEITAGTAPRLTLGSAGSTPKLSLRPVMFEPSVKRDVAASLSIRTGPRQALPTLDFIVAFTTSAPKTQERAAGKPGEKPAFSDVQARVTSSKLAQQQPGRLPPGVDQAVRTLEGSRIQYRLHAGGGITDLRVEPKAGAEEGLIRVLGSLGEFLPSIHGPYPGEPVGAGAFWMVTSRDSIAGTDTVTYRMMKVEQVEGNRAVLSIGTKRYSAGAGVNMPGLPQHTIEQFQCEGNGRLIVDATSTATEAHLEEAILASLAPQNEPTKRLNLQFQAIGDLSITASR